MSETEFIAQLQFATDSIGRARGVVGELEAAGYVTETEWGENPLTVNVGVETGEQANHGVEGEVTPLGELFQGGERYGDDLRTPSDEVVEKSDDDSPPDHGKFHHRRYHEPGENTGPQSADGLGDEPEDAE